MVQILLLEDDPVDHELIEAILKNHGVEGRIIRVDNREDFLECLNEIPPDLILADYILPKFDGLEALELAQTTCPDIPFILVSGVLGEEQAIHALQGGATDYVLKQRMERLAPAVQRALREGQERQERQQVARALHQTDNLLREIVDASPISIVTLSPEQRIITWNRAAESLYGWTAEAVVDSPLSLIIPEDQRNDFDHCFTQALQGHRVSNRELQHRKRDNSLVEVSLSLAPLHDADEDVYSVVMTIVDNTTQKQIEAQRLALLEQERKARLSAETTNRIKDEFLAVLSHELRTPLNAIVGWIDILKSRKLSEAMLKRALDTLDRNAKAQTQLIEDLLDISRIIRGQVSLQIRPVDVITLIRVTVDSLRPAAEAKSIRVELALASPIDPILVDPNRLQQVFWNLLSNAIKFTKFGGEVTVRCQSIKSQLQIQVADSGVGIAPDFLPHIFEYFRQADGSITRAKGGLGLGLAITRHLVELHGGTIEADSPGVDQGSTFTVLLPMRVSQADVESTPTPTAIDSPLQGIKIMVVEDEADSRELIVFVLEQHGADVQSSDNVQVAFDVLTDFRPNILISDIGMPDADGYTLLRTLRACGDMQLRDIPAIALTAYARAEDRQQALESGYQEHVTKPFQSEELVRVITSVLQSSEQN
ncbi:MAG: response regulator [Microcoleaceae cyanobacterium]